MILYSSPAQSKPSRTTDRDKQHRGCQYHLQLQVSQRYPNNSIFNVATNTEARPNQTWLLFSQLTDLNPSRRN